MEHAVASPQLSSDNRQMVLGVLKSVLDSHHFCKSKRYPALLEFAVRAALEENPHALKERTVGIEVFGRAVGYDTSTDPVVRIAMGEVRKRTALYFSEHPEAPVRIDLPVGSYKAEFCFRPVTENETFLQRLPDQTSVVAAPRDPRAGTREVWLGQAGPASVLSQPLSEPAFSGSTRAPHRRIAIPLTVVSALLLCAVAGVGLWRHFNDRGQRELWWPVLHGDGPAVILVGNHHMPASAVVAAGQPGTAADGPGAPQNLVLDDAIVAAQICSVFRGYGRNCNIAPAELAKVEDIRGKSLALVGGFNNPWTGRLLDRLPYQIQIDKVRKERLVVERKPTGDVPLATVPFNEPSSSRDYAIIARFRSSITDGMAVVVAGLGVPGTSSAGQYASFPEKFSEILSRAPSDWKGVNFEAVLQVDVVQGSAGHVEVMAARFW